MSSKRFPSQCLENRPQWIERCLWLIACFLLSLSSKISTWHSQSHSYKCFWHTQSDCKGRGTYHIKDRLQPSHLQSHAHTPQSIPNIRNMKHCLHWMHPTCWHQFPHQRSFHGPTIIKLSEIRRGVWCSTVNDFFLFPPATWLHCHKN